MKKSFVASITFIFPAVLMYAQIEKPAGPSKLDQTLTTAVIGATITLIGFTGKSLIEWLKKIKNRKTAEICFSHQIEFPA